MEGTQAFLQTILFWSDVPYAFGMGAIAMRVEANVVKINGASAGYIANKTPIWRFNWPKFDWRRVKTVDSIQPSPQRDADVQRLIAFKKVASVLMKEFELHANLLRLITNFVLALHMLWI